MSKPAQLAQAIAIIIDVVRQSAGDDHLLRELDMIMRSLGRFVTLVMSGDEVGAARVERALSFFGIDAIEVAAA